MRGRVIDLLGVADRLLGPARPGLAGEDLQRARLFVLMLGPFVFASFVLGAYVWALGSTMLAAAMLSSLVFVGAYMILLRRGVSPVLVAHVTALQICSMSFAVGWVNGGTDVPVVFMFAVLPMTQLLLMPVRGAVTWAVIISVTVGVLSWATVTGQVEPVRFPEARAISTAVLTLVVAWTGLGVSGIFYLIARHARVIAEQERDDARAANQAKTVMVADMSHELRTPMNGVIGMLDLVLDNELPGTERNRVQVARDSAAAFVGLLDALTDTTRIETGKFSLDVAPFAPAELLEQVTKSLRPGAEARGLEMIVETDHLPTSLSGDALRIRQILVNLIGNAIKYTDEGHVIVRSGGDYGDLRFDWILEIEDTGIGISDRDKGRVFERFEQTAEGEARRVGTGLGLAITAQIVGAMGGSLDLDSEPGGGTRIRVLLPLKRARATPVADPHESHASLAPLTEVATVLLVDDDPVNRTVARANLRALGCEVVEAVDGLDAITKAGEGEFDLILMDCQMPRLDGREATRRIRAESIVPPGVPVVALTASVSEDDRKECAAAGMNGVLTKPLVRRDLLRVVREAMARPDRVHAPNHEATG